MPLFSTFAIYFIIWWITLFAVLPLGVRTQAEENNVVPGSVESAPAKFNAKRVVLLTTIIAAAIQLAWYIVSVRLGYGIDSLPRFYPKFY